MTIISANNAEINAANVKVNITDDGRVIESVKVSVDEAVNIISRLNYRNDIFEYRFTTHEDDADIKYRNFDAYLPNGEKDSFAISEIVIGGKLEIVRFFNLFRDIIVDLQIGDVEYTIGYKGAIVLTAEETAATDAEIAAIDDYIISPEAEQIAIDAEQELADSIMVITTKFNSRGRLIVTYAGQRTSLQIAAEDARIDYRYAPINVINQYGVHFTYTRHIQEPRLGIALEKIKDFVRDVARITPITDEMVAGFRNAVKADFYIDKIFRDSRPCDSEDAELNMCTASSQPKAIITAFDLLPTIDELNDVSEAVAVKEEVVNMYGKTFSFINIGGERVTFIDGEVHVISSDKYNAHFNRQTKKYVAAIVEDGNYKPKTFDSEEEFFAEMAKRGACTIDEPEPPVDELDNLDEKIAKLFDTPPVNTERKIGDHTPEPQANFHLYVEILSSDHRWASADFRFATAEHAINAGRKLAPAFGNKLLCAEVSDHTNCSGWEYNIVARFFADGSEKINPPEPPTADTDLPAVKSTISDKVAEQFFAAYQAKIDAENNFDHSFATKTAKNGRTLYYIDGKRVGRDDYLWQAINRQGQIDPILDTKYLSYIGKHEYVYGDATTLESQSGVEGDELHKPCPTLRHIEIAYYEPAATVWIDSHEYTTVGNLNHVRPTDISEIELAIGDETVTYINGKFDNVYSRKYGAWLEIRDDGEIAYWTHPYHLNSKKIDTRDADRWDFEDFFQIVAERGAGTIDTPEPPNANPDGTYADDLACAITDKINAALPAAADPYGEDDNYRMARYITSVTFVDKYQMTRLPQHHIAIRSTDFVRAEKALTLIKAALIGKAIRIVDEPKIELYPIVFDADKIVTVYHAPETDGTEDDTEESIFNLLPDISELNDVDSNLFDALNELAECKKLVDKANDDCLKLCFALTACNHFYLNDLRIQIFGEHYWPLRDYGRKIIKPMLKKIVDTIATDWLTYQKYESDIDYCHATAYYGTSRDVRSQAYSLANEILNKLGEKALARELKKIAAEFNLNPELLTRSEDCAFNPAIFTADSEPPTVDPDEYAITPDAFDEATRAEEIAAQEAEWQRECAEYEARVLANPYIDELYRKAKEFVRSDNRSLYYRKKKSDAWRHQPAAAKAFLTRLGLTENDFIIKSHATI